jgi:3-isopropylmalate/(R)-2-methylmalate dehydratase small subunit
MAENIIRGKCWVASGYVMAYDIVVQKFWTDPVEKELNSKFIMSGVDPAFDQENGFKDQGYTFIVAGHNFAGGGKSIEHVVTGLMGAGIKAVFADSFSRLQFRNAINYGLPFITGKDIVSMCQTGDELEFDLAASVVKNLRTGEVRSTAPLAPFVLEVAQAGGLIGFVKQKIADGTAHLLR